MTTTRTIEQYETDARTLVAAAKEEPEHADYYSDKLDDLADHVYEVFAAAAGDHDDEEGSAAGAEARRRVMRAAGVR